MEHAFPHDELLPISCKGKDTLGGYALTLIDSLDSLAIMGFQEDFEDGVRWVSDHLSFDIDAKVSIFETNIRMVGGLISAHLLALEAPTAIPSYSGRLLEIAVDIADRLLPAFSTDTGIPMREINLRHGVVENPVTKISIAEAGTFSMEFGMLSHLTGDSKYRDAAQRAVKALYDRKLPQGVLGTQINPFNGKWYREGDGKYIGIGAGADSMYEYLLKTHLLFHDEESLAMFDDLYGGVYRNFKDGPWYVGKNIDDFSMVDPIYYSLISFWPGVQALAGRDIADAADTMEHFMAVWQHFGLLPESFDIVSGEYRENKYKLRPEIPESLFYMNNKTSNPVWRLLGMDVVDSISQNCKAK
eukprot:TRINITY_DN12910_c0_g1_i1.p1 TRINITY_DN12910_c0_g1~~TRINITY_DN12910_c0_g1_i1.p1  ORF type:complete len:408 (+),score=74.92 TRINITY_DN12910_c0_g1_i1:153-1226(+)